MYFDTASRYKYVFEDPPLMSGRDFDEWADVLYRHYREEGQHDLAEIFKPEE